MARKKSQIAPPASAPAVQTERTNELPSIIKQAYLDTFEKLGGVKGMVLWARRSPGAFYRQFAQLAPQLERHAKNTGVVVQVATFNGEGKKPAVDLKRVDAPPSKASADDPPAA